MYDHRPRLAIAVTDTPDGQRVAVTGEVDLDSAPKLDAVIQSLGAGEHTTITVDLTNVSFMDSSGIHLLLRAAHGWRRRGHRFEVIPPPRQVGRLFELTGTDKLLFGPPSGDGPFVRAVAGPR